MSDDTAQPPEDYVPAPQRSALARWSLILGCLFFIPPVGFVAAILGLVAIVNISGPDADPRDRRMAITGIVLGSLSLVLTCALIPFFVYKTVQPQFSLARDTAYATACKSNLKMLGLGLAMYQSDYNGEFPPNLQTLCDLGYMKDPSCFVCPSASASAVVSDIDASSSYYYARVKNGKDLKQIVPVMWDRSVHPIGIVNVLYSDGHVARMMPPDVVAAVEIAANLYEKEPEMPAARPEP